MPRQSSCKCIPCQRNRVFLKNNYYTRTGQLHRLIKPPDINKNGPPCECTRCVEKRAWMQKHRMERDPEGIVHIDFKPFGPGRYDWDRTTAKDYNRHDNGVKKTNDIRTIRQIPNRIAI